MISIYCSQTLDGIASAAIIMRHASLRKLPVMVNEYIKPGLVTNALIRVAKQKKQLIFFLDIPLEEEQLAILEEINKQNRIVYWSGPPTSIKPPAKFIDVAEKKTSARLVCARFLPHDKIAKQLATFAHDIKFWKLQETTASKIQDLIQFGFNSNELVASLAKGVYWDEKKEKYYLEHSQKKEQAIQELKDTLEIKNYVSYKFAFALVPNTLTSAQAGNKILSMHVAVDVAIVINRNGDVTFRRRDGLNLNMIELAKIFGGGGQEFAAGAVLKNPVAKENYTDVLFKLDQALKNTLVRNL